MIYRIDSEGGEIHEPLDWKLYSADRRQIALKSELELRAFLKAHPDQDFFLVPGPFMNREIHGRMRRASILTASISAVAWSVTIRLRARS